MIKTSKKSACSIFLSMTLTALFIILTGSYPVPAQPLPDLPLRILLFKTGNPVNINCPGGISVDKADFSLNDDFITVAPADSGIQVSGNGIDGKKTVGEEIILSPGSPEDFLNVNGKRYRGKIRIARMKNSMLIINLVPLEEYLYGVVPLELRTTYLEAGKAQAIVARTYTLGHLGRYEKQGYDFTTGTSFQMYGGVDAEDPVSCRAVDDTRGRVVLHKGKLAKYPLYHSTCGGATSDNETVFLTSPIPYLRGTKCDDTVPRDENSGNGEINMKNDGSDESSPEVSPSESPLPGNAPVVSPSPEAEAVKEVKADGDNCSMSSLYRWEVCWSNDELSKIINDSFVSGDTGIISDIVIEKGSPSGRINVLLIKTDKGQFRVRGDEIRRTFQFRDKNGKLRSLYSSRFTIEKLPDGSWRARGSGWGHGVGMCQFGALGLAKKGVRCNQILKKYFIDITIADYRQLSEFSGLLKTGN